jgi:Demerecviridae HNH endonuclease
MHGHFPDGTLDHKNHNRSSCRIADLREATRSQNSANSRMQRTNRSGFKGARWIKKCSKYRAQIVFRGKAVSLGYYKTAREAALAYDYVAGKVFGEFARTRITGLTDHSNP